MIRIIGIAVACFGLFAGAAVQAQQNINVRGTIVSFDGKQLVVDKREGGRVTVELPEAVNVATTAAFTLADIKPGMPLGVTTMKRGDGVNVAIDVRPIPPTASLGQTPHDLQPGSTMNNATFQGVASASEGNELTLDYKGGTVKALVVPGTAMSRSAPGSRTDLKAGETVFIATRSADGDKLTAIRIQVSKDGLKPTQ